MCPNLCCPVIARLERQFGYSSHIKTRPRHGPTYRCALTVIDTFAWGGGGAHAAIHAAALSEAKK